MRTAAIALITLIALVACASGNVPAPVGRPPLPLRLIEAALAAPRENDGGVRNQALAFVGREDLSTPQERPMCDALDLDPIAEIVRQSAGRRLVVINEAHDAPQGRAFISALAMTLRAEGFTIYAAETFSPDIDETRAWPDINDGWYSREPVFGQLLRQARTDGWRFAAYDDMTPPSEAATMDERMAHREARQAENLHALLIANPNARIFVHVGYDHLRESPQEGGGAMMAQILKVETGLDPLTIDQTRNAARGLDFVVCDPANLQSSGADIRLGAPHLDFTDGRPAWRQRTGQHRVTPPRMERATEPTIWEALNHAEPNEAVPVDRVLLRVGEKLPLLLPPGRYRLRSWTQNGGYRDEDEINVSR